MERTKHDVSPERRSVYLELCGGVPDAVSILARSVHAKGTATVEKTGSYADTELNGWISGSKARVVAADELHHAFPTAKLVTNSYVARTGEEHARITARELQRRGVSAEDIIAQSESHNTYTEILELIRLSVENGWHNVAVLVNEYQAQRTRAFWENILRLDDPQQHWQRLPICEALAALADGYALEMRFVAAEAVLQQMGRRHADVAEKARNLPAYQAAMDEDVRSAAEVRTGRYWGRPFRS